METVLWFLVWLALGCLGFYLGFRLLPRICGGNAELLKFLNIALGVLAFICLVAYFYYYFPGLGGGHDITIRRR
jgi:hypothetical protein